jgi:hypothetical protein
MYQHIAHSMSTHRLEEMVRDIFGIPIHAADFLNMRDLLSVWYRDTCQEIMSAMKSGQLIHIDETPVTLKTGKAYVWVLTSLREVIYIHRPNREGGFLHDLLDEFKGVLVSDFYGAYDSLPCAQQKCLVHFMRDINSDLIKNPFDADFKRLVSAFSTLMRAIVSTIDARGLKKQALGKHREAAKRFVREVVESNPTSGVVDAYRQRLERYGERMFTFLDHDGVPWNNAHAEHAIRRFARYRDKADGYLTVAGLEAYLVLLSLFQTCAYRDVDYLTFLLSQERSFSGSSERRRRKRLPPTFMTYPEDFINRFRGRSAGHLRRSVDRRIRIPYLRRKGETIASIMEKLGVSERVVVRALARESRSGRTARTRRADKR